VQTWRSQYLEEQERYRLLVLFGPSRTGKSRLARALFGDERTLVVDVQHAEHPDMRGYRRAHHRAVLFDEVQSPALISGNKKVLQAHADGAILGQSATQLFSYVVFLWRTPLMVTTNNWDLAKLPAADRNWIEENCVAVAVDAPVWDDTNSGHVATGPSVAHPWRPAPAGDEGAPDVEPRAVLSPTPPQLPVASPPRRTRSESPQMPSRKAAAGTCGVCGQRLPRRVGREE